MKKEKVLKTYIWCNGMLPSYLASQFQDLFRFKYASKRYLPRSSSPTCNKWGLLIYSKFLPIDSIKWMSHQWDLENVNCITYRKDNFLSMGFTSFWKKILSVTDQPCLSIWWVHSCRTIDLSPQRIPSSLGNKENGVFRSNPYQKRPWQLCPSITLSQFWVFFYYVWTLKFYCTFYSWICTQRGWIASPW